MPMIKAYLETPHWYDLSGKPQHDADLRVARKLGLLPSVTSVMNVWPKPMVDNYKIKQAIKAALSNPPREGEDYDDYMDRVGEAANQHRQKAAEFGKKLHRACEDISHGADAAQFAQQEIGPHVALFHEWFKENIVKVIRCEEVTVCKAYGFAGTFDMLAETKQWGVALLDYKTQGVKLRPIFYDTWEFQLAAYRVSLTENDTPPDNGVSVIINSATPSKPAVRCWGTDWTNAFRKFMACLALWRENKNFFYDHEKTKEYEFRFTPAN